MMHWWRDLKWEIRWRIKHWRNRGRKCNLNAPKEENPIAREADENRRRRQKEFEAIVALRALHDTGAR